jgi:hypothetical protein
MRIAQKWRGGASSDRFAFAARFAAHPPGAIF